MAKHANITIRRLLEATKSEKRCLHCLKAITGMRAYSNRVKFCTDVCRTAYHKRAKLDTKGKLTSIKRNLRKTGKHLEKLKGRAKELANDEIANLRRVTKPDIKGLEDK